MTTDDASRPAIPALFHRLCDDAALYPPGNEPVASAVPHHVGYTASVFSDLVGPFIYPIARLPELRTGGVPIEVALTAPGGPDTLEAGISAAQAIPGVTVVAVEIVPLSGCAVDALQRVSSAIEVYVEVPRDRRRPAVLDAVEGTRLRAKLRTGGLTPDAYPDEDELAATIHDLVARKIPFKATAGLHRAIRNTSVDNGFEQHGFLNILLAAHQAADGAAVADVAHVLSSRDGDRIAEQIASVDTPRVFDSFGTCSIREPLDDLISLGLIPLASGA